MLQITCNFQNRWKKDFAVILSIIWHWKIETFTKLSFVFLITNGWWLMISSATLTLLERIWIWWYFLDIRTYGTKSIICQLAVKCAWCVIQRFFLLRPRCAWAQFSLLEFRTHKWKFFPRLRRGCYIEFGKLPLCAEIEYFRKLFPGCTRCREIEFFSKVFPCGEIKFS